MAGVFEDVEAVELLAMLGIAAVGIYYVHKYFAGASCIANVGAIPGVTGATAAQAKASATANQNLNPGGAVIWTDSSDPTIFDYAQPNGDVVQVRHTFFGQLFGNPVTYTTMPAGSYVRPPGGIVNPAYLDCYAQCQCSVGTVVY